MEKLQKIRFILYVLEKLEVVNIQERRNAAQSLLYLVQGAYKEQEDYNNCLEVVSNCFYLFFYFYLCNKNIRKKEDLQF